MNATNVISYEDKPLHLVYTKSNEIHVREFIDNDSIHVEVYDPENPSETLREIFKPFITIKAVGQERGLGLAVCENIMQEIVDKVNFYDIKDRPSELTTMSKFFYLSEQFYAIANVRSPQGIPLYSILESGSIVFAILCLLSLSIWLSQNIPLINPFIAILGLVASPFFYWMGRFLRKKRGDAIYDDYAVARI